MQCWVVRTSMSASRYSWRNSKRRFPTQWSYLSVGYCYCCCRTGYTYSSTILLLFKWSTSARESPPSSSSSSRRCWMMKMMFALLDALHRAVQRECRVLSAISSRHDYILIVESIVMFGIFLIHSNYVHVMFSGLATMAATGELMAMTHTETNTHNGYREMAISHKIYIKWRIHTIPNRRGKI